MDAAWPATAALRQDMVALQGWAKQSGTSMADGKFHRSAKAVLLGLLVSGCVNPAGDENRTAVSPEGMQITFEDVPEPNVLNLEGTAVRTADSSEGGLWGVVADLRRPESAVVEDRETGNMVTVSLFRATKSLSGHVIMLSNMAADELEISDQPLRVRITALRSEPKLVSP